MSTTTNRTNLIIDAATFDTLYALSQIPPNGREDDARALRKALTTSTQASPSTWRVACDEAALRYIRERAPEVAARWPAVFGEVEVPRAATISQVCAAIGQTVAGIESDGEGLRLVFASGDALLIRPDGALDWRQA